jgi:SAM-dependent methyltransferase
MRTADPLLVEEATSAPHSEPTQRVQLASGEWQLLDELSKPQLQQLQWQQEIQFAAAIQSLPKGSTDRARITGRAYDTVCAILAAQQEGEGPLIMGLDSRYVKLVSELLNEQAQRGVREPQLFEVGYGSGALLKDVRDRGFAVGGVEISSTMRDASLGVLGKGCADRLLLGDLRTIEVDHLHGQPSLIYWNDVFEHICPDEIDEYLAKIYELLIPGGALVTITPNWLLRPSDVTADFCPPRTTAQGLHLKEYLLAEVSRLLLDAGFRLVATPLLVTRSRIVRLGSGLRGAKQLAEPMLDRLPVGLARLLCRGLGMSCTIATK